MIDDWKHNRFASAFANFALFIFSKDYKMPASHFCSSKYGYYWENKKNKLGRKKGRQIGGQKHTQRKINVLKSEIAR